MPDTFAGFDITSANSVSILTVEELFPSGITLEQFGTDQAVNMDSLDIAETRMGVDGFMVAGYTPNIKVVSISLEASSPSFDALAQVYEAMETFRRIYSVKLVSTVPSIGKVFTWSNGVLKTVTPFPSQKKVLDPTSLTFNFGKYERSST